MDLLLDGAPFTAAMAGAAGISPRTLKRLSATRQIRQLLHGVYVAAGVRDSIELRARAASLVLPEHCVVCDVCAAWLHGIDLLEFAELDLVPALDVVAIDGHQAPERKGVFGGKRRLAPDDIMMLGGIRVTTPIRTACDVARLRGRLRAIAALDAFRKEFGITEQQLIAMLPRYVAERGVIQLRELIPLSTDKADSQPESWVRLIIHDEGLPMPEPQVWTLLPDWGRVRMENAYAHLRIAVEYDGEEDHTSEADREHDRKRRDALRAAGWIIIVIRKEDLADGVRRWWLAELAEAIHSRAPELRTKRIYSRGPDEPSYHRKPRRRSR